MIERVFYETLNEELTKRGFFVATEHAPENCVGICGINGTEKLVRYVKYLQKNYRLAAIKNIIFNIGNDGSGDHRTFKVEYYAYAHSREELAYKGIFSEYDQQKKSCHCGRQYHGQRKERIKYEPSLSHRRYTPCCRHSQHKYYH